MLNKDLINSICQIYGVNKVGIKEKDDTVDFIIFEMNKTISLEKWNYFENILQEFIDKEVCVIDAGQAKKYLGENYLKEGVVIL